LRLSSLASQPLTPILTMQNLTWNYHFRIWISLQYWTWNCIGAAYR
jgi:hypothetical protein